MNAMTQNVTSTAMMPMSLDETRETLRNSLYPGASNESIDMVLGYCKAAHLDVMLKPVHIVPMWDSKSGRMRDVVMPGIGMYRVQASRSGEWAGVSEPEFGPMVRENIGGMDVEYPDWCRVTTRRLMRNGAVAEFTAIEFWRENYAVKGGKEKSIAPNAMWAKRPRGQIAKCAQAQSLRLAFPEIGSAPTAEEMEGKTFDANVETIIVDRAPSGKAEPVNYPAANFAANLPKWRAAIDAKKKTPEEIIAMVSSKGALSKAQKDQIFVMQEPIEGEFVEGKVE